MHWLMGRLNLDEVASDDVYAPDYFLEKFIAWSGYQITHAPQLGPARPHTPARIAADLARARKIFAARLREIESLEELLARREDVIK
jgi:hypothetical protein